MLFEICTGGGEPWSLLPLLKCSFHCSTGHIHKLVSTNVHQALMNFFHTYTHTGIQFHTFASYTFPCQAPFCQTAPILPSGTQQQNVMEYWWEGSTSTATLPTSTSDIMGQHNKIGGITLGAALLVKFPTVSSANLPTNPSLFLSSFYRNNVLLQD